MRLINGFPVVVVVHAPLGRPLNVREHCQAHVLGLRFKVLAPVLPMHLQISPYAVLFLYPLLLSNGITLSIEHRVKVDLLLRNCI